MASEVEICNLALARLGDDATVSSLTPPEGSAQAGYCARFYPMARDSLLEMHPWKFATRRAHLSPSSAPAWDWRFSYAQPANTLRILAVLSPNAATEDVSQPYESEIDVSGNQIILTDVATATIRYITRVTDTTKFSPLFTDALSWLLASNLAGPVLKGDSGAAEAKRCMQTFNMLMGAARVSDANQRKDRDQHTPNWIGGR